MIKILVCDQFSTSAIASLKKSGFVVTESENTTPTEQELAQTDGLLIRSRTKIGKSLLDHAPNLKVIVSATAGFDHIDYTLCKQHKVVVMHTPQANAQSAAELSIALMLAHLRNLPKSQTTVMKSLGWRERVPRGQTLNKKQVGIVGLGRIGLKVAKLCQAFQAQVSYYDPFVENQEFGRETQLNTLFSKSDVISLHVPLTQVTHQMIRLEQLQRLPKQALLVNCSRGKVIAQNELSDFLAVRKDVKVALDVFYEEPCKDQALLAHQDQLIGTPHIGAYTFEALEDASVEAISKIENYFHSQIISDPVPPNAAWAKDL